MRDLINLVERAQFPALSSPAFQAWFQGSKVIDKNGLPQVCYHGTFEDFAEFSYNPKNRVSYGFNRLGFWFDTDARTPGWLAGYDPETSDKYPSASTGSIYPCFLNIKKPFHMDSEYLFGDDQEEIRRLSAKVKLYAEMFHHKRDHNGNRLDAAGKPLKTPDGKIFTDRMYQDVRREYEDFVQKLGNGQHRMDGFWNLMKLLPGGIKSTTQDVVKFQQELISEGHDGIYIGDTVADFSARDFDTTHWWIAFHPNQIKSVFAKEFNADSDSISEDHKNRD